MSRTVNFKPFVCAQEPLSKAAEDAPYMHFPVYTHVFAFLFVLCHVLLLFIIIIFGSFAHLLVVCLSVYLFVLFACLVVALLVCLCVCGNTVRDI